MNFLNHLVQRKHQSLSHAIAGVWYMKKIIQNLPPLKKRKIRKKAQENEDKIKRNLYEDN